MKSSSSNNSRVSKAHQTIPEYQKLIKQFQSIKSSSNNSRVSKSINRNQGFKNELFDILFRLRTLLEKIWKDVDVLQVLPKVYVVKQEIPLWTREQCVWSCCDKQRARYSEQDYTIEFENLIEEEDFYEPAQNVVSDVEKDYLKKGKFTELLEHQRQLGEKQEEMLRKQEEDARLEDEAYIQAKKEAARSRKVKQAMDKNTLMKLRMNNSVEFSKWLAEEKIDVTSPNVDIEDFDSFLEKMRAKSAKNKAMALTDDDENDKFERTWKQGLQATIIAGDALNALNPVELHAVGIDNHSSTVNQDISYDRPFTPDFSSIHSTTSDVSLSTNTTPAKIETANTSTKTFDSFEVTRTDSLFTSALSSQDTSGEIEATPTNECTFLVQSNNESYASDSTTPNTITTKALVTKPKNQPTPKDAKLSNGHASSFNSDVSSTTTPSSFKMVSDIEKIHNKNYDLDKNTINASKILDSSRSVNNSGFLDDTDNLQDTHNGYGAFDEDDEFVSADGDFEELLV